MKDSVWKNNVIAKTITSLLKYSNNAFAFLKNNK